MTKYIFIGLLSSTTFSLMSQDFTLLECPVRVNGNDLEYPFTGGFSAPQFSAFDANQDGKMDLFSFDRAGNVPLVFIKENGVLSESYRYDPGYSSMFPAEICCWVLLRDFNRDGIADLFTVPGSGSISGVALYQGSITSNGLEFTRRRMGGEPGDEEILWFELGNNTINVTVPFNDKPDIKDVDGDGDLDLLTFDLGGSFVNYYKNLQEEKGLPNDTMVFELHDMCFGKFQESGFSETIYLSDDPDKCATGIQEEKVEIEKSGGLHAGSTILAFDNDSDGDLDLLLGDLTNRGLVYLENGGENGENYITSIDTDFPQYGLPVDMSIFLSAFHIDVNSDNLPDLLVAPNEVSSITNINNIWLYLNNGNPEAPFDFHQTDFLVEETIDVGSYSTPVFVDVDQDGLLDLVVGTDGDFGNAGPASLALYYYRNSGTADAPAFVLQDDDYLGFRAFSSTSRHPAPAFGDLDGDGDTDLVIGDQDGLLYFFENLAGPGAPFFFNTPIYRYMDIDIGQAAHPVIADLNKDGLGDLLIGERNSNFFDDTLGNVNYFENQGSVGSPFFNHDVTEFPNYPVLGFMDTRLTSSSAERGLSAPAIVEIDGELNVFLGSDKGAIKQYRVDSNNIYGPYEEVVAAVGDIYEGRATSPDLADIDNDGFLEMVIGNKRGGIAIYNTEIRPMSSTVTESLNSPDPTVFPNPADDRLFLRMGYEAETYEIYNIDGMLAGRGRLEGFIAVDHLPAGIYIIKINTGNTFCFARFVKS